MRDEHYKFRYGGWLGGEPDQRKEAVLFPGNDCFHFVEVHNRKSSDNLRKSSKVVVFGNYRKGSDDLREVNMLMTLMKHTRWA